MANLDISEPQRLQCSATLVKIALWSFVEGCQSGAPLFVSDPEANGEALISPIFFSFAFASK